MKIDNVHTPVIQPQTQVNTSVKANSSSTYKVDVYDINQKELGALSPSLIKYATLPIEVINGDESFNSDTKFNLIEMINKKIEFAENNGRLQDLLWLEEAKKEYLKVNGTYITL